MTAKDTIATWMCKTGGCRQFLVVTREQSGIAQRHIETAHLNKPKKAKNTGPSQATNSQSGATEFSQSPIAFRWIQRASESKLSGSTTSDCFGRSRPDV